ncbi:MAG TPA: YfhO family protein [Gemmataceae bacterium]|nr:YfhO family protein [Gemmataceae bacterium]
MDAAQARSRRTRLLTAWRRIRRSDLAFCAVLAAFFVVTRIVAFDGRMFFNLRYVPNHDMVEGLPFFATNLNSYRTSGDIAWWNPVSEHGLGYAQYYQSFLSPVAPTSSHILFVVWLQGTKVLSWLGITYPEYEQYLAFTYVWSPFWSFFFFSLFLTRIYRRRLAVILVSAAFAFSTVGLWLSAFFYFQESGTLFFLLWAFLGVLQRPTMARTAILLAAILVQVSAINYWTIYSSWFLLLMAGGYAAVYREQTRRAAVRLYAAVRQSWPRALRCGLPVVALGGLWLWMVASMVHEQKDRNLRPGRTYTVDAMHAELEITGWFNTRAYTIEPFNPKAEHTGPAGQILSPIPYARYIGVSFLPLLVLVPFYRWRRKERWLFIAAICLFCICMASPWPLQFWKWTPGMDRVRHFFYFYPHYFLLVWILLGGAALEKVLGMQPACSRGLVHGVALGLLALAFVVLLALGIGADQYSAHNPGFERLSRFAGLFFLCALLVEQLVRRSGMRPIFACLFVLIAFSDLTRYFWEVSNAHHEFTRQTRVQIPYPLPEKVQADLRRNWRPGDPAKGFSGGMEQRLPLETQIWPNNHFMIPTYVQQVSGITNGMEAIQTPMPDVRFMGDGPTEAVAGTVPGNKLFERLLIHDRKTGSIQTVHGANFSAVPFHFTRWRYNDFSIDVDCPIGGWVFLRLLYDPRWKVSVDGKPVNPSRANVMCMAIPASAGKHRVDLEYRPRARRWFWPACWLTEATLVGLMIFACRSRWRRSTLES